MNIISLDSRVNNQSDNSYIISCDYMILINKHEKKFSCKIHPSLFHINLIFNISTTCFNHCLYVPRHTLDQYPACFGINLVPL